jgi:hypothetical protein
MLRGCYCLVNIALRCRYRNVALITIGLLGVQSSTDGVMWKHISTEKRFREADLVVVGKLTDVNPGELRIIHKDYPPMKRHRTGRERHDYFDTGKIVVSEGLKGLQRIPEIPIPIAYRSRNSPQPDGSIARSGMAPKPPARDKLGIWFLNLGEFTGYYHFRNHRAFMPMDSLKVIRELVQQDLATP